MPNRRITAVKRPRIRFHKWQCITGRLKACKILNYTYRYVKAVPFGNKRCTKGVPSCQFFFFFFFWCKQLDPGTEPPLQNLFECLPADQYKPIMSLKTFVMSCEWRYCWLYYWFMPFESFLTQLDCDRLQKKAVDTRSAAWRFENLYSVIDSKMSTTSADKVCRFTLRLSGLTSNQSFYSMFNNNQLKYWSWLILRGTRGL